VRIFLDGIPIDSSSRYKVLNTKGTSETTGPLQAIIVHRTSCKRNNSLHEIYPADLEGETSALRHLHTLRSAIDKFRVCVLGRLPKFREHREVFSVTFYARKRNSVQYRAIFGDNEKASGRARSYLLSFKTEHCNIRISRETYA